LLQSQSGSGDADQQESQEEEMFAPHGWLLLKNKAPGRLDSTAQVPVWDVTTLE
jgi:hypothetical protein